MPREKKFLKLIPRIYKRNYEDVGMYFWVEAQRDILPALTIDQSIERYFHYVCEEDYNLESAISTYSILKRNFYESSKTNK